MLAQILPRAAAWYGKKIALVTDTRTLTYADLDMLSDRVAAALVARNLAPGDRVSLYAQNRWE
jgi:long-chain acyl-CoA synthetase